MLSKDRTDKSIKETDSTQEWLETITALRMRMHDTNDDWLDDAIVNDRNRHCSTRKLTSGSTHLTNCQFEILKRTIRKLGKIL